MENQDRALSISVDDSSLVNITRLVSFMNFNFWLILNLDDKGNE